MTISAGRFTARLAETDDDIRAAQRLRYRVFVEEMGANRYAGTTRRTPRNRPLRRDMRSSDSAWIMKALSRIRWIASSGFTACFEARSQRPGRGSIPRTSTICRASRTIRPKRWNLGRSCVEKDYRGGAAMQLLWMGLAQYIYEYELKLLFGCASFHGTDMHELATPLSYLHHKHLAPEHLRPPACWNSITTV